MSHERICKHGTCVYPATGMGVVYYSASPMTGKWCSPGFIITTTTTRAQCSWHHLSPTGTPAQRIINFVGGRLASVYPLLPTTKARVISLLGSCSALNFFLPCLGLPFCQLNLHVTPVASAPPRLTGGLTATHCNLATQEIMCLNHTLQNLVMAD